MCVSDTHLTDLLYTLCTGSITLNNNKNVFTRVGKHICVYIYIRTMMRRKTGQTISAKSRVGSVDQRNERTVRHERHRGVLKHKSLSWLWSDFTVTRHLFISVVISTLILLPNHKMKGRLAAARCLWGFITENVYFKILQIDILVITTQISMYWFELQCAWRKNMQMTWERMFCSAKVKSF